MAASPTTHDDTFKVLGICGGIGSGKSTAAKLLVSDCSCLAHLDADSLAHSVYSPGSQAVKDIADAFGTQVLIEGRDTLEIDRKRLGAIVFEDRNDMAKLERLVWPHVKRLLMTQIDQVKTEWEHQQQQQKSSFDKPSSLPVVVLEAAVLLDADWDDMLDGVWVVKAPREVALQRLMETRGLSEEESSKRIDAQQSRRGIGNLQEEIKNGIVTNVIDNSKTLDELKEVLQATLQDPKSWKAST